MILVRIVMGNAASPEKTWNTMLENWDQAMRPENERQVREVVRQGIPHSLRKVAWVFLSGAHTLRDKSPLTYSVCHRLTQGAVSQCCPPQEYLLANPSTDRRLIQRIRDGIETSWKWFHPSIRRSFGQASFSCCGAA